MWASLLDTAARGLGLKPYLAKLETEMAAGKEMKSLKLIVLTDSVPFGAPLYQVGMKFFQVGNKERSFALSCLTPVYSN